MNNKRILVIDDEDGVRDIIQITLEAVARWEVMTASGGQEGLKIAIAQQPDAILLDVMMPNLDGPATFKQLQAHSQTQHIPTIFLTAKAKGSEQQEYANLGVSGIIIKPFEAQNLVDQIREFLVWDI
ncbi:response regulator [Lyngbya sp. PCC 8106]|uniref:response regulator n=1 Tax=Lyngbya sp. (strain PCC 8106) TaxID=313612 RepID=UPI0000EA8F09|nr:response regulator [Lyngbya sp. PCC 8106]EAW36137.1 Response regulator receiver domain protein (CheY) [Lyngbya sp. PCC 8106]